MTQASKTLSTSVSDWAAFEAGSAGFDRLSIAIWIYDIDNCCVVWANKAALSMLQAGSAKDLYQRNMRKEMSPRVIQRLRHYQEDFNTKNQSFTEMWTLYPQGVPRPVLLRFSGARLADGRMGMLCEASDKLDVQPDTLRSTDALLHTRLMISLYSSEGRPLYLNPAARSAFAANAETLSQRFVNSSDYTRLLAQLRETGEASQIAMVTTCLGQRWHEVTARVCHDPVSGNLSHLISEADVSKLREAEDRASYMAYHDALTGLANRQGLDQIFAKTLEQARQDQAVVGVFYIDLNEFKAINDALGHSVGDRVLTEIASRFKQIIAGGGCQFLRLAGDEFLCLAQFDKNQRMTPHRFALDLMQTIARPIEANGRHVNVDCCIGVSVWPEDAQEPQELMQYADMAMYEMKSAGGKGFRMFHKDILQRFDERVKLASELPESLEKEHFHVYYQPRVAIDGSSIVGAEALVRWHHPERGIIAPNKFIPLCEDTGLIKSLGAFVLRKALQERKRWAEQGYSLSISVNVSQRQLAEADFAHKVAMILEETGSAAQDLELEITETLLIEEDSIVARNMERLRKKGIKLSIDDFGTGYSNFARLNEMSVDCLKIDRSLVQQLPRSAEIVKMVIAICRLIDATFVAEGVETEPQKVWLQHHNCDQMQGYLFAHPVPVKQFEALLVSGLPLALPAPKV